MNVALIYYRLLDLNGEKQVIGGVETYILHLAKIICELGWHPTLFQLSNYDFHARIDTLKIRGISVKEHRAKEQKIELYKEAQKLIGNTNGLIIFGADHISVPTNNRRCISIQHGISWDLPSKYMTRKKYLEYGFGASIKKMKVIRQAIKDFNNCPNRVCVDYNFLNWYRSFTGEDLKGRVWVIPNFCTPVREIESKINNCHNGDLKILFARRFTKYRGVEIMAEATKLILEKYKNVEFTFAGEGPEEGWLKNEFKGERRVVFIKYLPEETTDIHMTHDIAVVPSIASEGTALSVAEAMGAGCAIVATAVGGITNMIIDGYNGLLVMPNTYSLLAGLELVINDSVKRKDMQIKAFETAQSAFCLDAWEKKWKNVLYEVTNG